jgi:hypothetical protein
MSGQREANVSSRGKVEMANPPRRCAILAAVAVDLENFGQSGNFGLQSPRSLPTSVHGPRHQRALDDVGA